MERTALEREGEKQTRERIEWKRVEAAAKKSSALLKRRPTDKQWENVAASFPPSTHNVIIWEIIAAVERICQSLLGRHVGVNTVFLRSPAVSIFGTDRIFSSGYILDK
jgi:hypothetical protein